MGGSLAFGGGVMRGCVRFRPQIAASIDREIGPGGALDLARHLGNCTGCNRESLRQREFAEDFSRLPEIEPPEHFSVRVMTRVRALGPVLRRVGACAFFTLLWAGTWVASRVPNAAGAMPSQVRFGWNGALDGTVSGLGRSVLFVLSEVFSPRTNLSPRSPSASFGGTAPLALPVLVVTILLVAISLWIASFPHSKRREESLTKG